MAPCSPKSQSTLAAEEQTQNDRQKKLVPPRKELCGGFETVKYLAAGAQGAVWEAKDPKTNATVVVKCVIESENSTNSKSLCEEASILTDLCQDSTRQGVARLIHFSSKGECSCLVLERLGRTVGDRKKSAPGSAFSLQTTALVATQVIERIEYLHSRSLMHRDIKPENFMFGLGSKSHHVYLIDFGLSKAYWLENSAGKGRHIPWRTGYRLGGTPRYASMHNHQGCEQGRRDDLECTGYMLIHLLKGKLPWCGAAVKDMGAIKQQTPIAKLCCNTPKEFAEYMLYCYSLKFSQRPDYDRLRELFRSCLSPETKDHDLDWLKGCNDFQPSCLESLQHIPTSQPDDPDKPKDGKRRSSLFSRFFSIAGKVVPFSNGRRMKRPCEARS